MTLPDYLKIEDDDVCLLTWRGDNGKRKKAFKVIEVADAVALIEGKAVIVEKDFLDELVGYVDHEILWWEQALLAGDYKGREDFVMEQINEHAETMTKLEAMIK